MERTKQTQIFILTPAYKDNLSGSNQLSGRKGVEARVLHKLCFDRTNGSTEAVAIAAFN